MNKDEVRVLGERPNTRRRQAYLSGQVLREQEGYTKNSIEEKKKIS